MLLKQITVWRDEVFREASLEMALDHALLEDAIREGGAIARFYTWNAPAVTVGYFHNFDGEEESVSDPVTPVRRYTGGGLVEHGDDITFALIFPPGSAPASAPGPARYRWIHAELAKALSTSGYETRLHAEPFIQGDRPCFQHAVGEDLIDPESGEKICGGAQRRSRGAVIHQGSIRLPKALRDLNAAWIDRFIHALSDTQRQLRENEKSLFTARAIELQRERYGRQSWNRRRVGN